MTRRSAHPIDLKLPFWRYAELFAAADHAFLLDSALVEGRLGRHSFLGAGPAALLTGRRPAGPELGMDLELVTWKTISGNQLGQPTVETERGDPLAALRDLLAAYGADLPPEEPAEIPFTGGLVGYFGYETGRAVELLPDTARDDLPLPDLAFGIYDEILAHDHATGRTTLHLTCRGTDGPADRLAWWQDRIAAFEKNEPAPAPDTDALVRPTGRRTASTGPLRPRRLPRRRPAMPRAHPGGATSSRSA